MFLGMEGMATFVLASAAVAGASFVFKLIDASPGIRLNSIFINLNDEIRPK